jgi:hypothetical protein
MKKLPETCLRLLLLLGPVGLSIAIHACGPQPSAPRLPAALAYTYRLLPAPNSTFGYEVSQGSRPVIRQLSVPGRPGRAGFAQAGQAQATAALVVAKLRRGHLLPTITRAELDSLGVLN